ncbi:MAG: 4-alpha-glucanotransferase [Oscillospiraceae bacterium]
MMRSSGILMHISSLPGDYGIGKLGKEAYAFADFLKKSKQKYWQVLPLSPTSYGDSPYQSFSVYAGNPYFIDFESLEKQGLLTSEDYKSIKWETKPDTVDYGLIYQQTFDVLKKAYIRFAKNKTKDYYDFLDENAFWVYDYGLFMSLKFAHNGKAWTEWEKPLRMYEKKAVNKARSQYKNDIDFWCFIQYEFYSQWNKLKAYCNSSGIEIIGDIPIYVALDSVDVWTQPDYFQLDKNKNPIDVAGCPPDAFTELGQLWGNPLYDWKQMKKDGYKWWINRMRSAFQMYDAVRIDHFRGFESYYAIPFGRKDAKVGEWRKGPGIKLFKEIEKKLGKQKIIAEDLGFLTKKVRKMLKASGYPGMKVMEFAFDSDGKSEYLPHNFKSSNCVCYTGTHDNDTLTGWVRTLSPQDAKFCRNYLGVSRNNDIPKRVIRLAWASNANTAVAQMQDFLELGSEARMNTPSTLGNNWIWRCRKEFITDELAGKIASLTVLFDRNTFDDNNKKTEE